MKTIFVVFTIAMYFSCHTAPNKEVKEKNTRVLVATDKTRKTNDTIQLNYNNLTNQDQANYILKAKSLKSSTDACLPNGKRSYELEVTLTNLSNDTLKYVDWSCNHIIWCVDDKSIWIGDDTFCIECNAQVIKTFSIPPHKSTEFDLLLGLPPNVKATLIKFRAGVILERVVKPADFAFYNRHFTDSDFFDLSKQTQNAIWSDEITIP